MKPNRSPWGIVVALSNIATFRVSAIRAVTLVLSAAMPRRVLLVWKTLCLIRQHACAPLVIISLKVPATRMHQVPY